MVRRLSRHRAALRGAAAQFQRGTTPGPRQETFTHGISATPATRSRHYGQCPPDVRASVMPSPRRQPATLSNATIGVLFSPGAPPLPSRHRRDVRALKQRRLAATPLRLLPTAFTTATCYADVMPRACTLAACSRFHASDAATSQKPTPFAPPLRHAPPPLVYAPHDEIAAACRFPPSTGATRLHVHALSYCRSSSTITIFTPAMLIEDPDIYEPSPLPPLPRRALPAIRTMLPFCRELS